MGSIIVIVVEPGYQCCAAFVVSCPGSGVEPFGGYGPVVTLDLPVRLGPVGSGALVAGRGAGQRGGESPGAVAGVVIRQHAADAAVSAEPCDCSLPEVGCGRAAFVGEFFGIGQPRVVVSGRVQVDVVDSLPAGGEVLRGTAAVYVPAITVGKCGRPSSHQHGSDHPGAPIS